MANLQRTEAWLKKVRSWEDLILRTDSEPAIVCVAQALASRRRSGASVNSSTSLGAAEHMVRAHGEQVHNLRADFILAFSLICLCRRLWQASLLFAQYFGLAAFSTATRRAPRPTRSPCTLR